MFDSKQSRFASYGVVASIPGELIDSIWAIIDNNLQGVFPLAHTLVFEISNNHGNVTYDYVQDHEVVASFDTPFTYTSDFPATIFAYDSGTQQTILLPREAEA
ncbi:GTP cyclohydrolase [Loigolactobacillus coryniformis subsp. coryniformis]|uniref:GTP cyclohydrolase n=1 Tax=Loigolactobacillus coryniformis subsp. coryniformis KCTC 3167 = DSM 20001 TaxID=913848 RepID=A0A0R1F6F2_9LACO|nr:DUF960 domain-containing protein [Loigolactobacillus coryniformis]ATO54536.1 GTP cyclohydrolase [Loigolactobacillus coryniformis subsp. coryniformis KCTC 3167 = DSM 20001]KRK17353.1 hypothetical protein FD22_GL000961 [Loigolactobacillus coryniformis subsp. coryniformis KCTC 3167 = DSM 20001]OEH89997.1 GTP cyclohydrolase [Loigolactobacillus coryniformis subsp. coryniformis]